MQNEKKKLLEINRWMASAARKGSSSDSIDGHGMYRAMISFQETIPQPVCRTCYRHEYYAHPEDIIKAGVVNGKSCIHVHLDHDD